MLADLVSVHSEKSKILSPLHIQIQIAPMPKRQAQDLLAFSLRVFCGFYEVCERG